MSYSKGYLSKELQNKLFEDFPNLYRDKDLPPSKTRIRDGFFHGDGWYDLIYQLSERLEKLIEKQIDEGESTPATTFQVKQKFGTLRFYMTGTVTDEMIELINETESLTENVCEYCGKLSAGVDRDKPKSAWVWINNYCKKCKEFVDVMNRLESLKTIVDKFAVDTIIDGEIIVFESVEEINKKQEELRNERSN